MNNLSLVVAVAANKVIGFRQQIPWHLPLELHYFKSITLGKPVVMGRITYESIVARLHKPLPMRINIVVSGDPTYKPSHADDSVMRFGSVKEALEYANQLDNEIMVIGGAQIYRQCLPLASKLYRTLVDLEPVGDTWFEIDNNQWQLISDEPKQEGTTFYRQQVLHSLLNLPPL